jgi:hypothetical protein
MWQIYIIEYTVFWLSDFLVTVRTLNQKTLLALTRRHLTILFFKTFLTESKQQLLKTPDSVLQGTLCLSILKDQMINAA